MAITSYVHFFPEILTRLPTCPDNLAEQQLSQAGRMLCNQSLANIQHLTMNITADALTYVLTEPTDHEIQKVWAVRSKAGDSIVSITSSTKAVILSGDVTDRYIAGATFSLYKTDLLADDGTYTINTVSLVSGNTVIITSEAISADDVTGEGTAGVAGAVDGTAIPPSRYRFELPATLKFVSAPSAEDIANGLQVDVAVAPEEDLAAYTNIDFDFINRWSETIKAGALMRLFRMEDRVWASEAQARQCEVDYKYGLAEARREAYTQFVARDLKIVAPSFL